MQNLEIISTSITVHAKEIINGNTANFAWNFIQGQLPNVINFNIQRGVPTEEQLFIGNNAITGTYYPENSKFDIQNNNIQEDDFDLYQKILLTCKEINSTIQLEE